MEIGSTRGPRGTVTRPVECTRIVRTSQPASRVSLSKDEHTLFRLEHARAATRRETSSGVTRSPARQTDSRLSARATVERDLQRPWWHTRANASDHSPRRIGRSSVSRPAFAAFFISSSTSEFNELQAYFEVDLNV